MGSVWGGTVPRWDVASTCAGERREERLMAVNVGSAECLKGFESGEHRHTHNSLCLFIYLFSFL